MAGEPQDLSYCLLWQLSCICPLDVIHFLVCTLHSQQLSGFCANVLLGLSDALAYETYQASLKAVDPNYEASIAINWYFLIVSCVVLTVVGTVLVESTITSFPN